jgi:two-component system nitrate/nitrite response regulator NarL
MTRTRIFIVHENQTVAGHVMASLSQEPQLYVADLLSTANEALAYIGNSNCDIVLVSAKLANDGALKILKALRQRAIKAKVLITGLSDNTQQVIRYIAAGAAGYILEKEHVQQWARHIHAVQAGMALISPAVTAAIMEHLNHLSRLTTRFEPQTNLFSSLTQREIEILQMLAVGSSNQLIADKLIISVGTVKNHVHSVLKKLKLRSRKEAATYLSMVNGSGPELQFAQLM